MLALEIGRIQGKVKARSIIKNGGINELMVYHAVDHRSFVDNMPERFLS